MDWLASLSIEWVLAIAFALTLGRLALHLWRSQIGPKREVFFGELFESLLCAWVVVFLFVRPFFFEQFSIPSGSMIPTLLIGDRIVVNKYAYRFGDPKRGDIIVFRSPPRANADQVDFVKRLVGMPGETVDLRGGSVFVNEKPLDEPYVRTPSTTREIGGSPTPIHFPYTVPKGNYLMFGDNREESFDSRGWGTIEPWRIKGKAVLKFWPFSAFGALH